MEVSIMKRILRSPFLLVGMLALLLALAATGVFAENIVAPNRYAWGERVGWINFKPGTGPGITVTNTNVTGYAWGERIGWVSMNCSSAGTCGTVNYGVTNDSLGHLAGYAWSEREGWISFSCQNDVPAGIPCSSRGNWGVNINPTTGVFTGQAWGERIGWITFNCATTASCGSVPYQVQTGWRAGTPVSVGGIAEQPDLAGTSAEQTAAPTAGSGWSAGGYAALAAGLVVMVAVTAGAWYARRRRHKA